jgi:hypothetical protein
MMSTSAESALSGVEKRLTRLEDLEAIRQLFVEYGHHLDRGDIAAYASLFAARGELLLGPIGRATGPDEIRQLMSKVLTGVTGNSFHLITNPVIHLEDGAESASSEVTWAVVARGKGGEPELTMLGRHVDQLIKENGAWRFLRREGHIDLPAAYGQEK